MSTTSFGESRSDHSGIERTSRSISLRLATMVNKPEHCRRSIDSHAIRHLLKITRPYLRESNVRQSSNEVKTETARPALGTKVQGDTIRYHTHTHTHTHTPRHTHKAEKPKTNTLALVINTAAARGVTNGRPRVSDSVGPSHNVNRTSRLPAGVGAAAHR